MSITAWARQFATAATDELPRSVFRYVLAISGVHQLLLLALTVSVFLMEIAPLELQRRIINDLVKNRPYRWVIILCAVYAGVVLVQGASSSASMFIAAGSASAPYATCADASMGSSRRCRLRRPQSKRKELLSR